MQRILYYPVGRIVLTDKDTNISNSVDNGAYANELLKRINQGEDVTMPVTTDEHGNKLWELKTVELPTIKPKHLDEMTEVQSMPENAEALGWYGAWIILQDGVQIRKIRQFNTNVDTNTIPQLWTA